MTGLLNPKSSFSLPFLFCNIIFWYVLSHGVWFTGSHFSCCFFYSKSHLCEVKYGAPQVIEPLKQHGAPLSHHTRQHDLLRRKMCGKITQIAPAPGSTRGGVGGTKSMECNAWRPYIDLPTKKNHDLPPPSLNRLFASSQGYVSIYIILVYRAT